MKINELRLKNILKDYDVWEQEFEYAEVSGIAEIFGYHIVFFRPQKNLCNTVAINFQLQEIEDTLRIHVVHVANLVLMAMGINVKFGETTIEEINSIYGTADFMDDPCLYDSITYYYLINPDLLMAFTITGKVLLGLEIVADEEMVKDIVSDAIY
ncbi:MAG: hypothetical protein K2O32_07945 [Acetatifactor sp.]|nr:hypothetical protein [Acetatifactor sp.]